jgi:hypothetical protein
MGVSYFMALDYHPGTSRLVVAGATADSGLTNSATSSLTIPMIVMYEGSSFVF